MSMIQYVCFTGYTGFAIAAKNNIKALLSRGHTTRVVSLDLGFNKTINPKDFGLYNSLVKNQLGSDFITLYHCVPFMQRRCKCIGKKIGYATFETLEPPLEWKAFLNNYEIIITPSKFNYNIFQKQGYKNLLYLPHIIDFERFNSDVIPLFQNPTNEFKFLWIGTWKKRKNYELLIKSYLEEFEHDENVCLTIKTNQSAIKNPEIILKRIKAEIKNKKHFPKISFDKTVLSDDIMPSYIKSFNCFVSPTLGEGFGLPGLQSMAVGVPVITTNFGGVTDYANEATATLLEFEKLERIPCMDGILQFKNKMWPTITTNVVKIAMRNVYEKHAEAIIKAKYAEAYVMERFGYNQISILEEAIKIL